MSGVRRQVEDTHPVLQKVPEAVRIMVAAVIVQKEDCGLLEGGTSCLDEFLAPIEEDVQLHAAFGRVLVESIRPACCMSCPCDLARDDAVGEDKVPGSTRRGRVAHVNGSFLLGAADDVSTFGRVYLQ